MIEKMLGLVYDNTRKEWLNGLEETNQIASEEEAHEAGYKVTEGAYEGTTDDRLGRWYIQNIDSPMVDRRGKGYASKEEALYVIKGIIKQNKKE